MHDIPFHRHQRQKAIQRKIRQAKLIWCMPLEEVIENKKLTHRKDRVICSCSMCTYKWHNKIPISARRKLLREKDVE